MRVRLNFLGGFEARVDDGAPIVFRRRKAQALLAYLALHPDQAHPRGKLASLLWGETGDAAARTSLRQALLAIRHAVPRDTTALVAAGDAVRVARAAVSVDVHDFERLATETASTSLARAADLYRGDLLVGLGEQSPAFEEWLLSERERLREQALDVFARLLAHQMRTDNLELAVQTAVRSLALDALQEVVHRTLMRLYMRQGRRAAALRQYQSCIAVLQRELGTEPEPATRRLYREIVRRAAGAAPEPAMALSNTVVPRSTAPLPDTHLIGRDQEFRTLAESLGAAWTGRPQVAMVVGQAGIGKSRLVEEIARIARERNGQVLVGRCYETAQVLPFAPWVEALRSGGSLDDGATLLGLGPPVLSELARLFPELGRDIARESEPDNRLRLFASLAELLAALAVRRPALVILEDVHRADEMTLRFLAFLARRATTSRLVVLVTAREEDVGPASMLRQVLDELAETPDVLVSVPLGPLSRADTATLIRSLARAGTDEAAVARLAEMVWKVSEGNPFIAVETTRAMREGRIDDATMALPLPERVRQVIAGRLARLGDRSQQLVAVAAVIGQQFEFALLRRAAGLTDRQAAESAEELVRRRIVHDVGDRFDFTHDWIRAVAYERLSPLRRKVLHGLIAEAIETEYAGDLESHAATLGWHCRQAELWRKAVGYLRRAGNQALLRSAYRAAVTDLEQALEALARLPQDPTTVEQAIDLRFELRNALLPLGEEPRILDRLREAEALAEAAGDQPRLGRALSYLTRYFWPMGAHDRALECGHRALAIAGKLDDLGLRVSTNLYLGVTYQTLGDFRRARALHQENVTLLQGPLADERFGLPYLPGVFSRTWLIWCLTDVGDFATAAVHADHVLRLAERAERPWDLMTASFGAAMLDLARGDFAGAIPLLERALALTPADDYPRWFKNNAAHLGYAYALAGRRDDALGLLEAGVYGPDKPSVHHARLTAYLGEAYLLAGRMDAARGAAHAALDLARERKELAHEALVLRLLGAIAARAGSDGHAVAEAHYRQALARATDLGMRPLAARCHLGLGRVLQGTVKRHEGQEHVVAATAMCRELDMRVWLEGPD